MSDVTVVVPVLGRPQNAEPFLTSLVESTTRATAIVVADRDDLTTIRAWRKFGVVEIVTINQAGRAGTFAEKVNSAFRYVLTDWLLLVGDDVKFHEGWVEAALAKADETGAKVVGTAGSKGCSDDFSPHPLIDRRYIDTVGASWDGPGVVCHEGYRHNYVDLEIIAAAQQRNVWAMAWGSTIEHLHPFFGTAPDDHVYRLGQASVDHDAALWTERGRRFASGPEAAA